MPIFFGPLFPIFYYFLSFHINSFKHSFIQLFSFVNWNQNHQYTVYTDMPGIYPPTSSDESKWDMSVSPANFHEHEHDLRIFLRCCACIYISITKILQQLRDTTCHFWQDFTKGVILTSLTHTCLFDSPSTDKMNSRKAAPLPGKWHATNKISP